MHEMSEELGTDRRASGLRELVAEAGRRVEDIIDAAERMASEIRAEAEVEAERQIRARREEADLLLRERTAAFEAAVAGLTEKAGKLSDDARELAAGLRRAVDPLPAAGTESKREGPKPSLAAAGEAPDWVGPGPPPVAYPGTAQATSAPAEPTTSPSSQQAGGSEVPEQAVLRATQMAVAGTGRDEIERTLQTEFGVMDPGPFVDELLGPGAA